MLALNDALSALAAHPRAVPWRLRMHSGWSGAAMVRDYRIFAPALVRSVHPVLARAHNTILLLNPAAAELHPPPDAPSLEPAISNIRSVHRIGLFLPGEMVRPLPRGDLPGVDDAGAVAFGPGVAAGLDIGGTGMKACVVRDGALVRMASAPTWPSGVYGIDSLVQRARALIHEVAGGESIGSLGIGLAAPMGVGGRVLELSTVLRERVGTVEAFDGFARLVSDGLVHGPVAIFNDLSNLGRHLSALGRRRLVRLQIGTSFGGCWIDTNGEVYATEMGRLVVDVGPDAIAHTYLPLKGAMRAYLSNLGAALAIERQTGSRPDVERAGHALRALLDSGDPAAQRVLDQMADALVGVIHELNAILPGVTAVECGGSMLQGPTGRGIHRRVSGRVPVEFRISANPGHDGAIAAAQAPRVVAPLKGFRRVS